MTAQINYETCVGCGACVDICPVQAIDLNDGKAVVSNEDCIDCGACVPECPVESISMEEVS